VACLPISAAIAGTVFGIRGIVLSVKYHRNKDLENLKSSNISPDFWNIMQLRKKEEKVFEIVDYKEIYKTVMPYIMNSVKP